MVFKFLSSVATAPLFISVALAQTPRQEFPDVPVMSPTGVNMQTGTYVNTRTDIEIGSLKFTRSWRGLTSLYPGNNWKDPQNFGTWAHNYGWGVDVRDALPTANWWADVYVEGKKYRFNSITSSTWGSWDQDSAGAALTQNAGTGNFTFRNKNGDVFTIANFVVTLAQYADGRRLEFYYDSSRRLRTIFNATGDAIVLDYANGVIATACGYNRTLHYVTTATTCSSDAPEVKVSYGYVYKTDRYVLSSATYQDARTINMSYDSWQNPNLTCVTFPSSSTCEVTNEFGNSQLGVPPDMVYKQTLPTGEVWTYAYNVYPAPDPDAPYPPGYIPPGQSGYTDPAGFNGGIDYLGGIAREVHARDGVSKYEWSGTVVSKYTFPRGNIVEIGRDNRSNITSIRKKPVPGTGGSDIVSTYQYPTDSGSWPTYSCVSTLPTLCNKPTSSTDPNGNTTTYTHDPVHGGILTETGPAVNGVQPQKRYFYEQRFAWLRNAGGGYTRSTNGVWLLIKESSCKTGAASGAGCALPGDEVVKFYDYGPDSGPNLLRLRGTVDDALGTARRTCYGYDARGRKISETQPRAGLSAC